VSFKHPPDAGTTGPPPDPPSVTDRFGLGAVLIEPVVAARGELGRIWRFTTTSGTWAVKEAFDPPQEAAAQADVAFQQAALAAGVPLPEPVLTRDGAVLAEVAGPNGPVVVRAYSWADLADGPVSASPVQAAEVLGRIHALGVPGADPVDPWFIEPVLPQRWEELTVAATAGNAPWAATLVDLVPRLLAGYSTIAAARHTPTIRCHLDFNPQNVLLDRSGQPVVVDWENSGPASAEQELASAIAEFVPDPAQVPAFLAAYRSGGGSVTTLTETSFAMTLAVQSQLLAMYAGRALDETAPQAERARAAFWLADIAANVFTVDAVRAWVASVP
jgi:Ser/Thr protein kinase RdoA (MazF antagonist)